MANNLYWKFTSDHTHSLHMYLHTYFQRQSLVVRVALSRLSDDCHCCVHGQQTDGSDNSQEALVIKVIPLHTTHCTVHSAQCTVHSAHRTLYIPHCKLHTIHCIFHVTHYSLQTAQCNLQNAHCIMHTAHCK